MRWTRTLIPTLRDTPSDADAPSYRLMLKAGLLRKLATGVFLHLPLGARSLRKAAELVREEIAQAGAVEIFPPPLQPPELWHASGRYEKFEDELFRVRDREGRLNLLGPSYDEIVVHIARSEIDSYRRLPLLFAAFPIAFRDDPRPRAGVLRARHSLRMEAHSLDATEEGLSRSYEAMRKAFDRIFERAELRCRVTEADVEPGGPASHEYLVPATGGEERMVACPRCGYAANVLHAECFAPEGRVEEIDDSPLRPLQEVPTPGQSTVEQVCSALGVQPKKIIKTMILRSEKGFVAALVRGDHELNEARLARLVGQEVRLATPREIESLTEEGAFGFSGPVGLRLPIFADLSVEGMRNSVTGANRKDRHHIGVNHPRDFRVDAFGNIRNAVPGDLCSRCMAPLEFENSIEVGRLARIGTRFSAAMGATYKNERGEEKPIVMGRYELGVERLVAAAVEAHRDEGGIVWPRALAPFEVELVTIHQRDDRISQAAEDLYRKLLAAGCEVLWDDRDTTPGVKFADSDLIGFPVRVTVGNRTLSAGTVDLKARNNPEQESVSLGGAAAAVQNLLAEYRLRT